MAPEQSSKDSVSAVESGSQVPEADSSCRYVMKRDINIQYKKDGHGWVN